MVTKSSIVGEPRPMRPPTVPPRPAREAVNDCFRTGLAEVYEDYAAQALAQGDREAHGLWMTAASIARAYTPR